MWMIDDAESNEAWYGYTHGKIRVNGVSTIFGHVSLIIEKWFGYGYTALKYWMLWLAKIIAKRALPHLENERQQSVIDIWSCVLGNQNASRLQTVIKELLAAFTGEPDRDTLPARSWKWVSNESQRLLVVHLG